MVWRYDYNNRVNFSEVMPGKKILSVSIEQGDNEELHFVTDAGHFIMTHEQDCCETVVIKEIDNSLHKLIGATIVEASVESNEGETEDYDTFTWTFYKLATNNGDYFTISWLGESNGYYSESVDFYKLEED